jgi:hypothetical protein
VLLRAIHTIFFLGLVFAPAASTARADLESCVHEKLVDLPVLTIRAWEGWVGANVDSINGALSELGGTTMNPRVGGLLHEKAYFAVGIYPERTEIVHRNEVTFEDLSAFIKRNQDLLSDYRNGIGLWWNRMRKRVEIDVVAILDGSNPAARGNAIRLGNLFNQRAIWDAQDSALIPLPGNGVAPEDLPPIHTRQDLLLK